MDLVVHLFGAIIQKFFTTLKSQQNLSFVDVNVMRLIHWNGDWKSNVNDHAQAGGVFYKLEVDTDEGYRSIFLATYKPKEPNEAIIGLARENARQIVHEFQDGWQQTSPNEEFDVPVEQQDEWVFLRKDKSKLLDENGFVFSLADKLNRTSAN